MASEESTTPLLEQGKGGLAPRQSGNFAGDVQRWQARGGQNPLQGEGDVPVFERFTDIAPALPVFKVKQQSANILGAIFYLMLLAVCAAFVIASAILVSSSRSYLITSVTCSCNVGLLAVTGILQKHLVAEQQKEKRQGYIKFSKQLDWIIHLPFDVLSTGTALLLIAVVWQPKTRGTEVLSLLVIRIIILLEIAVTSISIGAYLRKVCKHHSVEREPDVMSALYSELSPPPSLDGIRYHDSSLAEQQAILLHYQQDNLRYLSKEILKLQETLSKYDRSQTGSISQVDVRQGRAVTAEDVLCLFAAREQEGRAVSAEDVRHLLHDILDLLAAREQDCEAVKSERDQHLVELRLARDVIAERDADIKKVEENNRQYKEENDRVRAMLEEWSSRTAKLELALEAERLSSADLQRRVAMLRQYSSGSK